MFACQFMSIGGVFNEWKLIGHRWDHTRYHAAEKDKTKREEGYQPGHRERPNTDDRKVMRKQARLLMTGSEKWASTPPLDIWEDVGEPTEVETDMSLDAPEETEVEPRKSDS